MTDVIIPTWAEVNTWAVLGLISLVAIIIGWFWCKKDDGVVTWIRDWNEPNIKEDW